MQASKKDLDKNLSVRFFEHTVELPQERLKTGKDKYKKKLYVEIISPSTIKTNKVVRPVKEAITNGLEIIKKGDKERFSDAYQAFLQHKSQADAVGTPLRAWALRPDDKGLIDILTANSIYTVEQLAGYHGDKIKNIPDFVKLKTSAEKWLKIQNDNAEMNSVIITNTKLSEKIDDLAKNQDLLATELKNNQQAKIVAEKEAQKLAQENELLQKKLQEKSSVVEPATSAKNKNTAKFPDK